MIIADITYLSTMLTYAIPPTLHVIRIGLYNLKHNIHNKYLTLLDILKQTINIAIDNIIKMKHNVIDKLE